MKITYLLLFLLGCLFWAISCKQDDKLLEPITIAVDPSKAAPLDCLELFEDFEYVYLSPNASKGYIAEIEKLMFDGDDFYVFQNEMDAPGIFKFDREGKLVFNVTSHEEGPGKFLGANDIALNKNSKLIEILDAYQSKIVSCSMEDGAFVKEIKTSYPFRQFVRFEEGNYAFYAANTPTELGAFNLYINKGMSREPKPFNPINPSLTGTIFENLCFSTYPNEGSYLYSEQFSNIVWRITPDWANEAYTIDFGKKWFDDDILKGFAQSDNAGKLNILNSNPSTAVRAIAHLEEFDKNLFFTYSLEGKYYWNFFDKTTHEMTSFYLINKLNNPNNFDGGSTPRRLLTRYQEYLIFELDPELVNQLGSRENANASSWKFREFAKTVPADGNPVIMLGKLKPLYQ